MKWQPIETAPKDGTFVLAYQEGAIFEAQWISCHWSPPFSSDSVYGCGCCTKNANPTHWMPLPEPPEQKEV